MELREEGSVNNMEEDKIAEMGTYTEATGMASMNLSTIS